MSVALLDAATDAEAWRALLERLPVALRDVYFRPEYVALHALAPGERARLFIHERGERCWAYPFVLRPIPELPGAPAAAGRYDIETAYGYGGPLASTDEAAFLSEAHEAFRAWARDHGVVAEFVRLHPLLGNERWLAPDVEVVRDRETVWLDLSVLEAGTRAFPGKTGNMLRRAERAGVAIEVVRAADHVGPFVDLYRRTLERLGADEEYDFGDAYFEGLARLADEAGWLLAAILDGAWVGAAFFLRGSTWLHYHLSATDPACRVPGVTNRLLYEAGQLGRRAGLRGLHLGGGRTAASDDSLLRFKDKMGSGRLAFHIARRVLDTEAYASLRSAWQRAHPELVARYGSRLLCYRHAP